MIGYAVKREPEFLGKPNPMMVTMALELYGYSLEDTFVVSPHPSSLDRGFFPIRYSSKIL